MVLLKAVIGLLLVIGIVSAGFLIYTNYKTEIKQMAVTSYQPGAGNIDIGKVSADVVQFYTNMRFNHRQISYYINTECDGAKKTRMEDAFSIFSEEAGKIINFYPAEETKAEILVGCSADSYEKEKNIFIAGEGGPTNITNSSMPVIRRGKILLYNEEAAVCDEPLLELHELIHVFGYDHISKENDLMYPYLNCKQTINPDLISHLKKIYTIEPYAELYFSDISAIKHRFAGKDYLNFNVSVLNWGIIKAENVIVEVTAKNNFKYPLDLDDIDFGAENKYYITNLPFTSSDEVSFEIKTSTKEKDLNNNKATLKVV